MTKTTKSLTELKEKLQPNYEPLARHWTRFVPPYLFYPSGLTIQKMNINAFAKSANGHGTHQNITDYFLVARLGAGESLLYRVDPETNEYTEFFQQSDAPAVSLLASTCTGLPIEFLSSKKTTEYRDTKSPSDAMKIASLKQGIDQHIESATTARVIGAGIRAAFYGALVAIAFSGSEARGQTAEEQHTPEWQTLEIGQ